MIEEFSLKRGRIYILPLLSLLLVGAGLWMLFQSHGDPGALLLGAAVMAFFSLTGLTGLRRLSLKGPALTLSPEGLRSPLNFDGALPWNQIIRLQRSRVQGSAFLKVTVDSAAAQHLRWHGLRARLGLQPKSFSIVLSQLDGSADKITSSIVSRCSAVSKLAFQPEPVAALVQPSASYSTYGLIALFAAVYVCELVFAVDRKTTFEPSTITLAYLGGDMGSRVKHYGEVWRMFTAPLMHAGVLHIGFNALALLWAGSAFERIAGWKWLLGAFALTALAGEAASITFLNPLTVGVGASGGIMGIIAALLVAAGRLPSSMSMRMRTNAMQFLVPALIPAFTGGGTINVFAHGGGAALGVMLGFVLLKFWPRENVKPPLSNAMLAAALVFFAVAAYAVYPISRLLAAG